MVDDVLIIGRPAGMEQLIGAALAQARSARFLSRLDHRAELGGARGCSQSPPMASAGRDCPAVRLGDFDALPADDRLPPDLILILQHWPEEYSRHQVDTLLATFPLARVLCVYGPWCASDGRTRGIWPPAVRVPAERAIRRFHQECDVIAGRRPPLPLTAGLDEIFAFDEQPPAEISPGD